MITKIGIVTGEIWQLLENNGSMHIKDINSRLKRPEFLILMGLGWLAREGHIVLEEEGSDFNVTLRKKEVGQTKS